MKKYIILLACITLLFSCGTAKKKSLQQTSSSETFAVNTDTQSAKTEKFVDTTKTENGKITITEIEFYPPVSRNNDTANRTPIMNVGGVDIANVGNIKNAAIKSIKQTAIESAVEQRGESKESNESEESKQEAVVSYSTQKTDEIIVPAPDPYRWRYIFGIILLLAIGLLYLKRTPVLNWIKTILSGIRKII
jgi:septal ring-binding cell division protein DamX